MKNMKMLPVPSELLAGFDPSAMTLNRSHKTKSAVLPKVTAAQLKTLKMTDPELFVMLLLATVGMVSVPQMRALLTAVPSPTSPTGFGGMMSEFQRRFGVTFDPHKAVGHLHNEDAAINFMYRLAKKNLVRTVLQGGNVRVRAELAGRGVEVAFMLTNFGAAVLLRLSTRDDLTVQDIKFCVHDSKIGLDTQTHDLGVSAYLTGLCVASAHYSNRAEKPTIHDVVQVIGDGHDFEVHGVKVFRPDLSVVQFISRVHIPLYLEWNTDNSTTVTIAKKVKAYLQLMLNNTEPWAYGRPWLVFATPTEGQLPRYQKAVREAVEFSGLMNASTYNPLEFAGIAVCTYEDLGRRSAVGSVYRVFDFNARKFTDEKFSLVSLCKENYTKNADKPVEEPKALPPQWNKVIEAVGEEVANGANPPEWTKDRKGAASRLIGHFEDLSTTTPPVALVLNGGE